MHVLVLGLGPVGLATTWDLLRRGHTVQAYDKNPILVQYLLAGEFKRSECFADDFRESLNQQLKIEVLPDTLPSTEALISCVGTPSSIAGFDMRGIEEVLGQLKKQSSPWPYLVIRSTFAPGTLDDLILPQLPEGAKLSYYPEFLREKFAKEDVLQPPLSVAAHLNKESRSLFSKLFPDVKEVGGFQELETLKLACNAFHALKVTFANEVGSLCQSLGIDGEKVMELFCQDKKLNLSENYLKPGKAFGGPCLDKDLLALEHALDQQGLSAKVLRSIRQSNNLHKIEHYAHSLRSPNQERIRHYQLADQ